MCPRTTRSWTPWLWAGGWASSATQCLPTSPEGTSGAYLAPTASLLWGLSGTRRASRGGKRRRRVGCVASRSASSDYDSWGGALILEKQPVDRKKEVSL